MRIICIALAIVSTLAAGGCRGSSVGVVPGLRPASQPVASDATATPVNAGLDAVVATMDSSDLANEGAAIAAYVQHYEIHTIFLELSYIDYHTKLLNHDPSTVAALDGLFAVSTVYMIAGNKKWQLTPSVVPPEIKDLVAIGAMYPQFAGLVYDLEPQTLPGWKTNRQQVITQYVQFLNFLLVNPGGYAYKKTLILVGPYYSTLPNSSGTLSPSLLQQVESLSTVAGTFVTDYYEPPPAQMKPAMQQALAQINKPVWVGSTTDLNSTPGISYHGTAAATFIADMMQLRALVAPRNPNLSGLFDNAWNAAGTSLQSVLPP